MRCFHADSARKGAAAANSAGGARSTRLRSVPSVGLTALEWGHRDPTSSPRFDGEAKLPEHPYGTAPATLEILGRKALARGELISRA